MNENKLYTVDDSEPSTIEELREINGDTLTEEEYQQIENMNVGDVIYFSVVPIERVK